MAKNKVAPFFPDTVYMLNTWRKCFTWSGSGTKNVPGPDRINLVPVRNKTRYGSGTITRVDGKRILKIG